MMIVRLYLAIALMWLASGLAWASERIIKSGSDHDRRS